MASWKDGVAIIAILSIVVALIVASGVGAFVVKAPLTSVLDMGTGSIQIGGVAILSGIVIVIVLGALLFYRHSK